MAKSKDLDVLTPRSTPDWGLADYACVNFYGGNAVLMGEKSPGYFATDSPHESQHPRKDNPGGSFRYFG